MTHQLEEELDKILANGDFYFETLGDGRYRSSWHTQGAWNAHEQHMAPASGILTHALENFQPRDDMRIARLSFEIHGLIHAGEFEITTRMIRPGRTIELIEAEMTAKGAPVSSPELGASSLLIPPWSRESKTRRL